MKAIRIERRSGFLQPYSTPREQVVRAALDADRAAQSRELRRTTKSRAKLRVDRRTIGTGEPTASSESSRATLGSDGDGSASCELVDFDVEASSAGHALVVTQDRRA